VKNPSKTEISTLILSSVNSEERRKNMRKNDIIELYQKVHTACRSTARSGKCFFRKINTSHKISPRCTQ